METSSPPPIIAYSQPTARVVYVAEHRAARTPRASYVEYRRVHTANPRVAYTEPRRHRAARYEHASEKHRMAYDSRNQHARHRSHKNSARVETKVNVRVDTRARRNKTQHRNQARRVAPPRRTYEREHHAEW